MAVKTVSNAGGNWASASTWSPSGVPSTTADVVVFATSSGPLYVNAPATIESIDFRNYQDTLYLNYPLTVTGNMNFGTGSWSLTFSNIPEMTEGPPAAVLIQERGRLVHTDSAMITTWGRTWSAPWEFGGVTETVTLNGDLILGEVCYFKQTGTLTINRVAGPTFGALITRNDVNIVRDTSITTGTATFSMSPVNGTHSWSSQGGVIRNNLFLNPEPTGILRIGWVHYGGGILSTTSSSVDRILASSSQYGSELNLETSCSVNTGELRWDDVTIDSTLTLTFLSDFYVNGTLTIAGALTMTSSQISQNNFRGKFKFEDTSNQVSGSMTIYSPYTQENPPTGTPLTFVSNLGNHSVRNLTVGGGAFNLTLNRNIIYVHGSLVMGAPFYYLSNFPTTLGTTEIHMVGTGSIDSQYQDLSFITPGRVYSLIRNNILINTQGTINIGRIIYETGSFSHISGAVVGGDLIIDDTAARINFPGHTWSSVSIGYWVEPTFGYFTNRPGFINRTLTYDWNTDALVIDSDGEVNISGPSFSFYTRGLYAYATVSGTSSIILGEKGITTTQSVTMYSTRGVCNPLTVNTSGPIRISNSNNAAQFIYSVDRGMPATGVFRYLSGYTSFNKDHQFILQSDPSGTSSLYFNHGSMTFSSFAISSIPSGLNLYLGSTISSNTIRLTPNDITAFNNGIYTSVNLDGLGAIRIYATGSSLTASTIEFARPGFVQIIDSTLSDEGFYCRNARFTATVSSYNTADGITQSQVGAAGNAINHPRLYINNGTYSIETDCKVNGTAHLTQSSILFQKPGNIGLLDSSITVFGDFTMRGDINLDGSLDLNRAQNINWGTSSISLYNDSYLRYFPTENRLKNLYWIGNVFSSLVPTSKFYTWGTFSVENLYLRPSTQTRNLIIGEPLLGSTIIVGTLSLGTQSGYTFNVSRYRNIGNTIDYPVDFYVNNYIGFNNSTANALSPITIASTWSGGSTPSNTITNFTVDYNAIQDLQYVNARRINSGSAATVWSYKGTFSQTTNWNNLPTQPKTIQSSFSS